MVLQTEEKPANIQSRISNAAVKLFMLTDQTPHIFPSNIPVTKAALDAIPQKKLSKIIKSKRDSFFPETRTEQGTEAVMKIGTYIDTVKSILNDFSIQTGDEIKERTEGLQSSSIEELDWRNYTGLPQKDFNYKVTPLNLLKHEHRNLLTGFTAYTDMAKDSENGEERDFLKGMAERSAAKSINLLSVLKKFTEDHDEEGFSLKELISTLNGQTIDKIAEEKSLVLSIGGNKEINVYFDFDTPKFDTFEEFLSIRTLIHNASKENVNTINVRRIDVSEDGDSKVYVVEDDAPVGEFNAFSASLEDAKNLAAQFPDEPILIEQRGGKIVALMAGRRGDEIWTKVDPVTNTKSIFITFAGKGQTGKQIREEFEKEATSPQPVLSTTL